MVKTTQEKIEVMKAFTEGAPIEFTRYNQGPWKPCIDPLWDWFLYYYRVALTKPSINWDHVSPQFNYMATGAEGSTFLYESKPTCSTSLNSWRFLGEVGFVESHSSFKKGNCDWKDSLVCRPGFE